MASIYQLKSRFQDLLRPTVVRLAHRGVTANQVTVCAFLLSCIAGVCILGANDNRQILLAVPFVMFARMALNAIDGMLAREHNMKSDLGAFLNELVDVGSDAALYLPFALINQVSATLVVGFVLLSVISEMTGVIAVQIGASRRYDGPMGKSDRAFVMGAVSLPLALGLNPEYWFNILLGILCVLVALTIRNRVRGALKEKSG